MLSDLFDIAMAPKGGKKGGGKQGGGGGGGGKEQLQLHDTKGNKKDNVISIGLGHRQVKESAVQDQVLTWTVSKARAASRAAKEREEKDVVVAWSGGGDTYGCRRSLGNTDAT